MSKQRARNRAAREAAATKAQRARDRRTARRAAVRRLRPRLPDRRTGRLYPRRTRAQRAGIAVVGAVALAGIWLYADSLTTRVALTALVVVAAPVLIVLTLDRRI